MLGDGWTFGSVLWAMLVFYFCVVVLYMFVRCFVDIFSREDLRGIAKAGWILLIILLPFIGLVIYIAARPREVL